MRYLLLFKSYYECWYFDISRQTALLVSCHRLTCPLYAAVPTRLSFAALFSSVSPVPHSVVSPRSGRQAVSSSHYLWHPDWEQVHRVTDQRVSPGFHKQLWVCFSEFVPLCGFFDNFIFPGLPFWLSSQKLEVYCAMHFLRCYCIWDQMAGQRGKKGTREVPPRSCWDHSSTCWRGRFPSLRVLNPFRSLLPMMPLQPVWDCLGLGVWEQREERRGMGGGRGVDFQPWAHYSLARIGGLLLELLSVLMAPCWVVGYIAFRLGNTREKMVSLPVILKFLSSFQVSL